MSITRTQTVQDNLASLADGAGVDAILISDLLNIGYLSGFTGSTALIVLTPAARYFLTDFRYTAQARGQCAGYEIVDISKPDSLKEFFAGQTGIRRVGFEAQEVTVARLAGWQKQTPDVTWVETTGIVENLRLVKDADEIAIIEQAIHIAQHAFMLTQQLIVPGTTEQDYALQLEFAMRQTGADGIAFNTIVASGPNGAFPHYHPGTRAFEPGDFVTVDWGATLNGYNSDITRTVAVSGAPLSYKQVEIYRIVNEAKALAISAIAPGKTGKEIDSVARDYIAAQGYGEYFGHSLGHSLGRHVHDGNMLSQRAELVVLAPGMVTTVEPGIYIEGLGGVRLEEDVLVTEDGFRILTDPV